MWSCVNAPGLGRKRGKHTGRCSGRLQGLGVGQGVAIALGFLGLFLLGKRWGLPSRPLPFLIFSPGRSGTGWLGSHCSRGQKSRWDSQDRSFCHTHLGSVLCIFHIMLLLLPAEVYLKTHWVRSHHLLVTWQLIFFILVRFHVSLRDKDVPAFQDLKRKISAPRSNWRTPREWWFWRNSDDFSVFFHLLSPGLFPQF